MAPSYELSLRDYIRILSKRRQIVLSLTILCALATFVLTPQSEPKYQADASVKITHQSTVASMFLDAVTWTAGDDLATQSQIIGSLPMALKVGQALNRFPAELKPDDLVESTDLSVQVAAFNSQYRAEPVSGTGLIKITATTPAPKSSIDLANTVVDVFIREHTYEKNRQIIESRKFIEEQLKEYQRRLRESEGTMTAFKKSHLTSLSLSENEMARLNEMIEEDDRKIRALGSLIANLKARIASSEMTYVDLISGGSEDPAIQDLNSELVRLQMERERLLVLQQESSPAIEAVEAQIQRLARRLLDGYEKTLAYLTVRRDELSEKLAALPENDAEAARLAREVKVNEDVYTLLQQRYQEALIKEAEKIQEVSVVEYAADAQVESLPGRLVRSLVGLAIGLLLGLMAAFVLETLDTSIDTIEDVEAYLEVPVVGMVPHFEPQAVMDHLLREQPGLAELPHLRNYASVVARHDRRNPASEAYGTLRTNLQFAAIRNNAASAEARGQVFLFTSASAGEGKTTTVVNLSVVMAQMGKRVLLFECDLRNPGISKFFGVSKSPGLTEAMLGSLSLDEAVRSGTDLTPVHGGASGGLAAEGLDRLHILTSGTLPPQPAEILISSRFGEILSELRARFDVILIDSPPVLPVTDAAILGTKVDGVVLVYQLGRVSRNMLRRAKLLLENVHAPIWGIVLNSLRANVTGYSVESYYGGRGSPSDEPTESSAFATGSGRDVTSGWLQTLKHLVRGSGHNGGSSHPGQGSPPPPGV